MSQGGKLTSSSGPGSGDVVGPASSTNNDIVVFSGTTGKVIKDTGISSISPSFTGSVTAATGITSTTGNIVASAGNINATLGSMSAGTTITAGTGITSTTGNIVSTAGAVTAGTSMSATTTITAGTGLTVTTGNAAVVAGNLTLPDTNGAGTAGEITMNSIRVMSDYPAGSDNFFLGHNSGNTTNTGSGCTALGLECLKSLTTGTANTAIGNNALETLTSGTDNVAIGFNALTANNSTFNVAVGVLAGQGLTGTTNTLIGASAGVSLTSADGNTAVGYDIMHLNQTGDYNTAMGQAVLPFLTSGELNLCLGYGAGYSYTSSESHNICIANNGIVGESNKLRIGVSGSGSEQVNECYIAGISGVTVAASVPVVIDTNGQMGTIVSAERYKENIEDIPENKSILKLRPVQFNYKSISKKDTSYGFIAEEVEKEFKDLCIYDDKNVINTVKYHEMPALLLLEIKRLVARVEELEKRLTA